MILRWVLALCLAGSWQVVDVVGEEGSTTPSGQFETLSYDRIVRELDDLATNYPHLAQVQSYTVAVYSCMVVRSRQASADFAREEWWWVLVLDFEWL